MVDFERVVGKDRFQADARARFGVEGARQRAPAERDVRSPAEVIDEARRSPTGDPAMDEAYRVMHGLDAGIDPHDPICHPAHYCQGAVECIEAIEAAVGPEGYVAFLRGQVIKYAWRLPHKGASAQDAAKLAWYADRLAGTLEKVS